MALFPVRRDAETPAFFDGTARGEFLLVRDTVTGELLNPRTDTSFDRARFEHAPASGEGTVVTWSVPHTRLPDDDLTAACVKVRFESSGDGEAVPYFASRSSQPVAGGRRGGHGASAPSNGHPQTLPQNVATRRRLTWASAHCRTHESVSWKAGV
ncbi:hypothetical protein [Amycolatopsis sp. NPDC021455]|uniref:hypothetical protein n=1 Tax=Amycolatopsis sp. NPDC021455 TaxID=3154901 RepID=UPI0033D30593